MLPEARIGLEAAILHGNQIEVSFTRTLKYVYKVIVRPCCSAAAVEGICCHFAEFLSLFLSLLFLL